MEIKQQFSNFIKDEENIKKYIEAKSKPKNKDDEVFLLHPMTEHEKESFNWLSFYNVYKREAEMHGMSAVEYFEKQMYPNVFKKDGTYRADRVKILKLKTKKRGLNNNGV